MKKITSIILTFSLIFSSLLLVIPRATAEGEVAAWAIQTSRNGDSNGSAIKYTGFDWSSFGENLVPDPTVAHFDENGVYGEYATPDANYKPTNINPYYWWDKYIEKNNGFTMYKQDMLDGTLDKKVGNTSYTNGFQSPKSRSMPKTTGSLTDDGSGVLQMSSSGGYRAVALPRLESDKYYIIKMNIKCGSAMSAAVELCTEPNITTKDLATAAISSINLGSGFANGKVDTATYVVYTGSNTYDDPFVRIYCKDNILTYLDDFGVYEISKDYADLCSEGTKLPEVTCNTTAYGYRQDYSDRGYICNDEDNLVTDYACESSQYWSDANNYVQISEDIAYEGITSLKVSGNGTFKKRFEFDENTDYFLSVWGYGSGEPVSNVNFGFMDIHGHKLENPLTETEANDDIHSLTRKDNITIQCQDGTWYNRVYRFNTGNTTQLYFFITGTIGTLYLDNIKIFKQSDAISTTQEIKDLDVNLIANWLGNKGCDEQKNLIPNGDFSNGDEFWKDFNGYGESVEVVTAENNNVLHFKGQNNHCYYLPYVTVQPNVEYRYSFWAKNISGSQTRYGVVALNNPMGYISDAVKISASNNSWKQYSVTFTVYTETKIAFAIYDIDGEAVFDKFRLFKSSDAKNISNDTPADPTSTFEKFSIGENNEYRPQYETADIEDYGTEVSYSDAKYNQASIKVPVSTTLERYNYYVISCWIKGTKNTTAQISYYTTSNNQLSGSVSTVSFENESAKRISMLIYTGGNQYTDFNIGAVSDKTIELSDIQVVKLEDNNLGKLSIQEKRLFILGDIDYSLRIDAGDLTCYRKSLLNDSILSIVIADVNNDGEIDIKDLVRMKKMLSMLK